jgi:hypothetical protein
MKKIKLNKYEKRKMYEEKLKNSLSGSGVYIYENNTDGDLSLPKLTTQGIKSIGPRKRFEGDSYYMKWVGSPMNLLKLIEEVSPQNIVENKENEMREEKKLILDQPETINRQGQIEHVVDDQVGDQNLNDGTEVESKKPDILLNESPVDGVEIILG